MLDATLKDWDLGFELNVKSMFLVTRAFLPGMLEKGGGSIINMASVAGSDQGCCRTASSTARPRPR